MQRSSSRVTIANFRSHVQKWNNTAKLQNSIPRSKRSTFMTKQKSKQKSIAFGKPYFHALKGGLSGKEIEQAVCTSQSTVFLSSEGKIYQTGTLHGQIYESPTLVEIKYALKCVEISAGRHFCLGRLEGGQAVVSWGAGKNELIICGRILSF